MTIQILSLTIALLAVIIGPIITYRMTKKQLEFQFRTNIREKWVNKLEKSAHSFLKNILEWIEKYPGLRDGSSQSKEPNNEIDRMFDSINSSFIKLHILLDENKSDQKIIIDNIIQMKSIINNKDFNANAINSLRDHYDNIIIKLKIIFHQERSKITKIFR